MKMKVKIGSKVKILTGKDKGKEGQVVKTFKKENKVVVAGINIAKKHTKPNNVNNKGGIFDIETPIHVSNVKVIEAAKAKETKEISTSKPKGKQVNK